MHCCLKPSSRKPRKANSKTRLRPFLFFIVGFAVCNVGLVALVVGFVGLIEFFRLPSCVYGGNKILYSCKLECPKRDLRPFLEFTRGWTILSLTASKNAFWRLPLSLSPQK